jgi:hypothetical protein
LLRPQRLSRACGDRSKGAIGYKAAPSAIRAYPRAVVRSRGDGNGHIAEEILGILIVENVERLTIEADYAASRGHPEVSVRRLGETFDPSRGQTVALRP